MQRRVAASARGRFAIGVALAAVLGLPNPAPGVSRARLRWLPAVAGVEAAGYLVYARRAAVPAHGAAIDVGLPPAGPDGSHEYVLEGLAPAVSYAVSVSGYSADGREGARSGELVLAARAGPCAGLPEGAECDAGDPCISGRCAGGSCHFDADARVPGAALRARIVLRRGFLRGRGAFVTRGLVDPLVGGASVEIVDALETLLYRAEVPGEAFRVRDRGRTFRHAVRAVPAGDIRHLVLRHRGDVLTVRLDAFASEALADARAPLSWVLRVGEACVRQINLNCEARRRRWRCS